MVKIKVKIVCCARINTFNPGSWILPVQVLLNQIFFTFAAMLLYLFIQGIFIGVLISLPVGPVNIMVIQQTISKSRLEGFFSGLGVAISDTLYAILAGFSVAFILQIIREYGMLFKIIVSLVLAVVGVFILFSKPGKNPQVVPAGKGSYVKRFISAFLLTAANPLVVFLYMALFTTFGIVLSLSNPVQTIAIMSGFLFGAIAWWFSITGIINRFKDKFTQRVCIAINRITGGSILLIITISLIYFLFF